MVFIMGLKKYDTETSEKVMVFLKSYPLQLLTGHTVYTKRETILYKTKNGNWFITYKGDHDKQESCRLREEEVKQILEDLNSVELYIKHFGKLEEA